MAGGNGYITVSREAEYEMTIEKSRFIARIFPISSREEAEEIIARIRREYRDATHNVPVIICGPSQETIWSSEDGEPQGTAGAPVLKMLMLEGITNVLVVITRYFGGIKLGTGGLVRAYTEAAAGALKEAGRVLVENRVCISCKTDYKTFNKVKSHAFSSEASIEDPVYQSEVVFDMIVKPDKEELALRELDDISAGKAGVLKKTIKQCQIIC